MSNKDIALQLTLKAIEEKHIEFEYTIPATGQPPHEVVNQANAKAVTEFYNSILDGLRD